MSEKDYLDAKDDFTRAIRLDSKSVYAYNGNGLVSLYQGHFAQAEAYYTSGININPNLAELYFNRGVAFMYEKKFLLAIADFTKGLAIHPKDVLAHYTLGNIFNNVKVGSSQAILEYTKAIEIDPKYVEAYLVRGETYYRRKQLAESLSDIRNCIKMKPTFALPYELGAFIYFDMKEYDLAWEMVRKAKALGYKPDIEDLGFLAKLEKVTGLK